MDIKIVLKIYFSTPDGKKFRSEIDTKNQVGLAYMDYVSITLFLSNNRTNSGKRKSLK